jgi:hypothetical protein
MENVVPPFFCSVLGANIITMSIMTFFEISTRLIPPVYLSCPVLVILLMLLMLLMLPCKIEYPLLTRKEHLFRNPSAQSPGGSSIYPNDFPAHKSAYAMRDMGFLERQATPHGAAIGRFAHHVLEGPLPWTRMRVYALFALVRRYG